MSLLEVIKARPGQLEAAIEAFPAAYVALGSIEWHGPHLPLGFDGLKAEALLRRVAERVGKGVLFPTMYWRGYQTMNFPYTIHTPSFSAKDIARQLYGMGFKVVVLVTGHYPPAQVRNVRGAATWLMKKHKDAYAIGIPEQFLLQDLGYLGDHAAKDETSMGLALVPGLVDVTALPKGFTYMERCTRLGVMGHDPAAAASAELGERAASAFVERLSSIIEAAWEGKSQAPIWNMYRDADRLARQHQNILKASAFVEAQGMDSKKDLLAYAKWFLLHSGRQVRSRGDHNG
ncbi:MAG: creatininase family protein [Candidatus Lokiarchaeota archaeon]|nr:creatininase family protein [Candidatus Lokiarchaeota archaeon]